jgi:multiple sugar transport system permease protein
MSEQALRRCLIFGGAVFMATFCLLPLAYMAAVAVAENPEFLSPRISFTFTWNNFRDALSPNRHLLDFLRNSVMIAAVTAAAVPILAGLAAYPLARMPLRGKPVLLGIALALSMFPPISLAGALYRMLSGWGWINTPMALILPYTAWLLPFGLWFLTGYFASIPRELDRAARVDGCSHAQILRKVLFPLALPGLVTAGLLAFIFAYNEFLFALLFTVDHNARTVPVGIALFQGAHGELPWGALMAASLLAVLPALALTLLFQRRIVQGLTRGAVKG